MLQDGFGQHWLVESANKINEAHFQDDAGLLDCKKLNHNFSNLGISYFLFNAVFAIKINFFVQKSMKDMDFVYNGNI